jgi:hypothetical protein
MTKRWAAFILLLAAVGFGGDLLACGDKFLVVNRNTRFKRAGMPRPPAAILVYANPRGNLPRALGRVPVDETLRKAGYRPTSVTSAEALDHALETTKWDLVLADEAECRVVRERLTNEDAPVVLPVLYNATRAELQEARRQFPLVVASPTKSQAFLEIIDEAIESATRPSAGTRSRSTG